MADAPSLSPRIAPVLRPPGTGSIGPIPTTSPPQSGLVTDTSMNAPPIERDEDFYWDTAVFLVEDRLFRVPRVYFETYSELFRSMFSLPRGDNVAEGDSDASPIHLSGISKDDFKNFLSVVYPPRSSTASISGDAWWSALKLATLWGFSELRKEAIEALSKKEISLTPTERIVNAQRYKIPHWFIQGCSELIRRSMKISQEEAQEMGIAIAIPLCHIREDYPPHNYIFGADINARIRQSFEPQLRDMDAEDSDVS